MFRKLKRFGEIGYEVFKIYFQQYRHEKIYMVRVLKAIKSAIIYTRKITG